MKKHIRVIVLCLLAGLAIAIASFLINTGTKPVSTTLKTCNVILSETNKGFPLPYLSLEPSVTSCNSVESPSILWKGNASHDENTPAFLADWLIWSGLFGLIIVALKYSRTPKL